MYSRANMTSPMTILRYIQYIDSKSRVELSWGALGVSRAKNKDKVRRQDKLSSLLFGGIWPPTASFTVRLFMYSRRVDTGGLGLYYIYCIYLCILQLVQLRFVHNTTHSHLNTCAAGDFVPQNATTIFCLGFCMFCMYPYSME